MSVNSSTSSNTSSLYASPVPCFFDRSSTLGFITFAITNIIIVFPLCILIIFLGVRRWQQRSSAPAAESTSHSDIFTYNMVAVEIICSFGGALFCGGTFSNALVVKMMGLFIVNSFSNGQVLIHTLTCVERYVAVVHPITYMRLRNRTGVRIRNILIVCIWLILLPSLGLLLLPTVLFLITELSLLVLSAAAVSFCSHSVLFTLNRPGPGDGGKDKERTDKLKMRAFHTIIAITATLMLRLNGHVLVIAIYFSPMVSELVRCTVLMSGIWFSLPSSLVLPLLFLHRAGKLTCCKTTAGQGSE